MTFERLGDVTAAIEQFELLEAGAGVLRECGRGKCRVCANEIGSQPADEKRREERLERVGHATSQELPRSAYGA